LSAASGILFVKYSMLCCRVLVSLFCMLHHTLLQAITAAAAY